MLLTINAMRCVDMCCVQGSALADWCFGQKRSAPGTKPGAPGVWAMMIAVSRKAFYTATPTGYAQVARTFSMHGSAVQL
jgi:hypothetical protein